MSAYHEREAEKRKASFRKEMEDCKSWWKSEGRYFSQACHALYNLRFEDEKSFSHMRGLVLVIPLPDPQKVYISKIAGMLCDDRTIDLTDKLKEQYRAVYAMARKRKYPMQTGKDTVCIVFPLQSELPGYTHSKGI